MQAFSQATIYAAARSTSAYLSDRSLRRCSGAHGEAQPHLMLAVWLRAGAALLRQ